MTVVAFDSARLWRILSPILSAASFTFFLVAFVLYGKEPQVTDPGDYVRDPVGGYTPALLGYLLRFGTVEPMDMVSTTIDLARKGYARIVETPIAEVRRYDIVLTGKEESGLLPHEKRVLDILREVGASKGISGYHLRRWAELHPLNMYRSFYDFSLDVQRQGMELNLVTPRLSLMAANVIVAGLFLVLAIGGLDVQGRGVGFKIAPGPLIAIAIVALQLALTPLLRRRTKRGAEDFRRWMAFKHFLKDFSDVSEWTPDSVAIWEDYLVYAFPLGEAHAVAWAIDMKSPPSLYNGFGWFGFDVHEGRSFADSIGGLSGSFVESAADAFAQKPPRAELAAAGLSRKPVLRPRIVTPRLDARARRARG